MQARRNQGVDEPYVKILEAIYSRPTASVVINKESNETQIKQGVTQAGISLQCRMFTGGIQSLESGTRGVKS